MQRLSKFFKSILSEMSVKCQSGEQAAAQQVSEKVKERIKQTEMFVGIFSRGEKIEGKEEWSTSAWVIDEKAHAQALGKKLVLLKEIGIGSIGGLQGDYEYIEFDRERLHRAAVRVIQTIWSLNPGKMQLSRSGPPGISVEVLEAAIAAQPEEPMLRVTLAQQRAASGRLEAAIRELQVVLTSHPSFVPAQLELAKTLASLGRRSDAMKELDCVLKTDPLSAMAHHLKGHILEGMGDPKGAKESLKRAVDYDPGGSRHYRCLGQLMLRAAKGNRSSLEEARCIGMAVAFGGQNENRLCRPHLQVIERMLKTRSTGPTVRNTKRKKRRR